MITFFFVLSTAPLSLPLRYLSFYPPPLLSHSLHKKSKTGLLGGLLGGSGDWLVLSSREGRTALMAASSNGHTEAIKLLLTAPGIDVNHAHKVSLYLLIPPYLVVKGEGDLPHLISRSI